jgi:signal transduction histidine kinase
VSKAAKEIAEGDFNKVITIKTGDEFEDLANAFNYMTEKIREDIRELNNLIKELERRDTQKTQFLANISHELRTPLTASIGYVDYLKKEKMGPLNEDQKHSLEIISRNLERLNKEIHSLLLVSRFTLEGVKLFYEIFDISDAIENILNNFVPEMKLKRLVVKKDIRVRLVYADKEGINTVLENLISNGIKFSEPDTNLEIKTCIINENNQEYFQFKISNHGIGIPEDQLEKIFEPFYQVDATTSRRYGGIGLGLSIARNIIEAHQGKIWAESRGGVTCFYFKIPNRRV